MTSTHTKSGIETLFSLAGKKAIVSGAARGNGKAIASALLDCGAEVLLLDVLPDALASSMAELSEKNSLVHSLCVDLSVEKNIQHAANYALEKMGAIDILVNNAGISLPQEGTRYSTDNWRKTLSVNLDAAFWLASEVAEQMKSTGGSIINVTSLNAELAFPNNPAYMASKGALRQLGKSMALDYAQYNIRVNNVGPGYMHTAMTEKSWNDTELYEARLQKIPLGRWGEPEDLGGIIVFLASQASSYITGQDIYVDGGWMIKGL